MGAGIIIRNWQNSC